MMSSFLEEDGEKLPFEKNIVKVRTKKNSVETIKVYY
jgi:hypothetical protein